LKRALRDMQTTPSQPSNRKDSLRGQSKFLALVVFSCALLPYFSPGKAAPKTAAPTTIIYHLDGVVSSSEAGVITALNKGYFGEAGLDVRIVEGTVQDQSVPFVANNSKAIGVTSVFDFLRARATGQRLVVFASAFTRSPITFYVRHDSNIRSVADFAGKAVAYDSGRPTAIVFDALLAQNHISKSSIKEVSGSRTASALVSRMIDILPGEIGQESRLLSQLGQSFDQISPDAFGLHLPGGVYFTREDTLRNDPDLVRNFLRAVVRGWDTVYQKNTEDLRVIATALKIPDIDSISLMLDQQRPLLRPSGTRPSELDPVFLNSALSILVQQRLIMNPPRLADAVNFEITKDIYRSEPKGSFAN
jgi:ABC-type nitrate/sulfonate/bicarbonate transport system substrate-binding protein